MILFYDFNVFNVIKVLPSRGHPHLTNIVNVTNNIMMMDEAAARDTCFTEYNHVIII